MFAPPVPETSGMLLHTPLTSKERTDAQASNPSAPRPEVTVIDGAYHLRLTADLAIPMLQHNAPLRYLGEGWNFHALYTAFAPVLLFELEHISGSRATWFFDSTPAFLGHTVENIPLPYRKILVQKASVVLRNLFSPVFGDGTQLSDQETDAFFDVSETARLQIGEACLDSLLAPVEVKLATDLPEIMLAMPKDPADPVAFIARVHLTRAIEEDFQDRLIQAVLDGELTWPSAIDGAIRPSSGSLCFNFFAFAYRMEDPDTGLVYYLLTSEHKTRLLGFYFPSEGLIVARDENCRRAIAAAFPNLPGMMMDYACRFGGTLLPYLVRGGPKQMAATLRENHLGHQLWNELSGLDILAAHVPPAQLPALVPLDGTENAFFGPLEDLFPEFSGRSRPDLRASQTIIDYANRNDLALARFTRDFISSDLRGRIVNHMRKGDDFRAVVARRALHRGPVILIGLRVENRTAVDLTAFVTELVKHVSLVMPGALIVLDGQNANDPATGQQATTSFLAHRALRSPLEVEMELCQQVVASVDPSAVLLESASGKPLATSIAWATLADCVISFWGAGLAKYRWVANTPTLALTNRDNLMHRGDLLIYSLPRYMANPSETVFANADAITDDLDAPQLVPLKEPSYANFHVNQAMFFEQVSAFLARVVPETPNHT